MTGAVLVKGAAGAIAANATALRTVPRRVSKLSHGLSPRDQAETVAAKAGVAAGQRDRVKAPCYE
jgi:hypothetical protein